MILERLISFVAKKVGTTRSAADDARIKIAKLADKLDVQADNLAARSELLTEAAASLLSDAVADDKAAKKAADLALQARALANS